MLIRDILLEDERRKGVTGLKKSKVAKGVSTHKVTDPLQRAKDEQEEELYKDLGTYIAMTVNEKSASAIRNFMIDYEIENPVPPAEMHVTVYASDSFLKGLEPWGILEEPIFVHGFTLDFFDKTLVAKFESQELEDRHNEIDRMFPDAKFKESEFIPHITLSYDGQSSQIDLDRFSYFFNEYVGVVELDSEYVEPMKNSDYEDS